MANPIKAAKQIFDEFLSKHDPESVPGYSPGTKDPQAQAAGRKGARSGGIARARSLTPAKRKMIAKQAAKSRWSKS